MSRLPVVLLTLAALAACDDPVTTEAPPPPMAQRDVMDPGEGDEEGALILHPRTRVAMAEDGRATATGSMRFTASSGQQDVKVQVFSTSTGAPIASNSTAAILESAWAGLPFLDKPMSTTATQFLNEPCGVRVDGYTDHAAWYWMFTSSAGITTWGRVSDNSADSDAFRCVSEGGGGSPRLGEDGGCERCQQWLVYDMETGAFLYDYWECEPVSPDLCSTLV